MNAQQINVLPIVNNDWIFATKKGLQELEMIIENREQNLYRNRKIPRAKLPYDDVVFAQVRRQEKKRDRFDEDIIQAILQREENEEDGQPLELITESLRGFMHELKDLQKGSALPQKE